MTGKISVKLSLTIVAKIFEKHGRISQQIQPLKPLLHKDNK